MVLRAVIFDLGGTLIYHTKDVKELLRSGHQAMTGYLVAEGFEVELDDVVRVSNGIYDAYASFAEKSLIEVDARVLYSAILYQLGIADYFSEDLITGAINSFYGPLTDDYCVYEDARGVLSGLRGRGLKLGLISNNQCTDFHQRLLRKFGLENLFDSTVVSSRLGVRKPHKRIFLHCLVTLGVSMESSVFVGDEPIDDVQGAKNAGIKCIWVKRKSYDEFPAELDWVAESLSQAEEIIASLLP